MTEPGKTGDSSTVDDLDRLRLLLFGEKISRLYTHYQRINDIDSRTDDVAEVLPDAMHRVVEDPVSQPRFERPIVATIRGAIKRDTESFAEALCPVLGPAIRRAVSDALKSLVQRINVTMENSFSIKGLRWRLEAARSGVPFGQIVLRETMLYAVQEVFLIQPHSGLVLASVRRSDTLVLDEDAFSSMLTAIQAFIQDSLGMPADEKLRSAELGDRTLWVINGPQAALACLVIGSPPHEVRDQLMDALETLHARFGDEFERPPEQLTNPDGITALMQEMLQGEVAEQAGGKTTSKSKFLWGVAGLALLLFVAWTGWSAYQRGQHDQRLAQLFETEPGYVLTSHETSGGQFYLAGLRDPLAASPESLLQSIDADVESVTLTFRPYQSLDDEIVMRRLRSTLDGQNDLTLKLNESSLQVQGTLTSAQYALLEALPGTHPVIRSVDLTRARLDAQEAVALARRQLNAPETVVISPAGDHLELSGSAPPDWFVAMSERTQALAGWPLDFAPLRVSLQDRMDALQSQVSGRVLLFARRYEFTSEAQSQLDILGQQLVGLQELAAALETELTIQLEGFADGLGTPDENREIALMRARTLQSELSERGVLTASMTVSAGEWVEGDENPDQRKVVIQINRESAR